MKVHNQNQFNVSRTPRSLVATFMLGILAGNTAQASFPYPNSPLQTGSRVPANLMLVLDDSGSMASEFMPDSVPATAPQNNASRMFTRNSLYYNPTVNYLPWRTSTGARVADTPYSAVYTSDTLLTGTANLYTDVGGNLNQISYSDQTTRLFLAPKPGITDFADTRQYYRYNLNADGTATRLVMNAAGNGWVTDKTITNFVWDGVDNWKGNNGPITRTVAQEMQNFATWYSFHRTRNKAAKAGVSEAFADLGEDIRVGYNTIWNRNNFNIPVGTDDGLFRGANKDTFYARLQAANASGTTPLRASLTRTGEYFSDSKTTGPYGPQSAADQITCRQNFTLLTSDGYWNEAGWTDGNGGINQDGLDGSPILDADGKNPYTYKAEPPYSDITGNTLADVAMKYWKNDLRTDLVNNVAWTTADPAFWQHMVTFAISIGVQGTPALFNDYQGIKDGTRPWTVPVNNTLTALDDMWHASINGRGDFVVASDPQVLANALKAALSAIVGRIGSSSNISANSVSVGSDTLVYQASYFSGQWTGELKAFPVSGTTVSTTSSWVASEQLPAYGVRNIFTRNVATSTGSTFPTVAQEAFLTTGIANYIKGDRSNEIAAKGIYRNRVNVLGDIINSSPAYVKDNKTVFVGANDGMLHAFDGTTGVEKFAYVPGIVNLTDLKSTADTNYDHRYLVDGPIVVSNRTLTPSKNILIGSLGRGGKGLYALDVTDPSAFSASKVLWEADGTDPYMGNVISSPLIAKVNFGNQMAVLVSNGINSANDSPALLVYGLESGTLLATLAPIDSAGVSAIGNNGLSAATGIDYDLDGDVDYVYAGDLKGNLWKFDLSDTLNTNWKVANVDISTNIGRPLFSAKDAGGVAQPITGGVAIAFDDTETPWIYFGTGLYLTSGDPSSTKVQTWYGLRDANAIITGRSELKERKVVAHGTLNGKPVRAFEPKIYNNSTNDMAGKSGWYIDLVNDPQTPAEEIGERIIGTPIVRNTSVIVSSIIPSLELCTSAGKGYVNVVELFSGSSGIENAAGYLDLNGNGIYTDDTLSYIDAKGKKVTVAVGSVDLGVKMVGDAVVLVGNQAVIAAGGSQGGLGQVQGPNDSIFGRISWRELINN